MQANDSYPQPDSLTDARYPPAMPFAQARSIVAVIPAYNEDRFIASVVLKTRQYVSTVIVVDDGSTDLTASLAEAAGAIVVRHSSNQGKSAALNTGLRHVTQMSADVIVLLDGDGQHHPQDIPAVLQPVVDQLADIVVGSRFMRLGNRIPRWRIFGQHALTSLTNALSGVPLTDSQSGFRALSEAAIRQLRFSQGGFIVESEMQFLARELGLRMLEVPIGVTYAEAPKRNPVAQAMQIINGLLRLFVQMRPLLFFGVPGAFLLMAGIIMGLGVVMLYDTSRQLAIGSALVTIMLVMVGTLSLFTGFILHSIRGLLIQWVDRLRA